MFEKYKDKHKKEQTFDANSNFDKQAEKILREDALLLAGMEAENSPLPFEIIFKAELDELYLRRHSRFEEDRMVNDEQNSLKQPQPFHNNNPNARAKNMELAALSFSGGGIRSATFCLGVLQSLAKHDLLRKIDYLSTVSGGGYIGSWLSAWIKRDGSVKKVSDRLNPVKSADPMGEDVRPIRWLRMFSNYFAPDASIMSIDAWTVGVTWLRNMLLNLVIIFMLLITVLFMGRELFLLWQHISWTSEPFGSEVLLYSILLIIPVSIFISSGMKTFDCDTDVSGKKKTSKLITALIPWLTILIAYFVSAWLFTRSVGGVTDYLPKLKVLIVPAIVGLVGLLIVGWRGRYIACIRKQRFYNQKIGTFAAAFILIFTATLAICVGWLAMGLVWQIMQKMSTLNFYESKDLNVALAFTFGVPLVLVALSVMVVTRMAILGIFFPDERREWWGRMGASVNRLAFLWVLIAGSALLIIRLDEEYHSFSNMWKSLTGGWLALVGATVKAAFSSKTSGKEQTNSVQSKLINILGQVGPYIFILGLLIFLPLLLNPLVSLFDYLHPKSIFQIGSRW